MRKLLVTLDDELDTLLSKYPNQNEVVREATRLYIGDITTDTLEGLRASYVLITKHLKEIESKIDYIGGRV